MMWQKTYKEVLLNFNLALEKCKYKILPGYDVRMIKNSIEKQIPKELIDGKYCPRCENEIEDVDFVHSYCCSCGQLLKEKKKLERKS